MTFIVIYIIIKTDGRNKNLRGACMRIGIFYFSGTGNTELIAKFIGNGLINRGNSVEYFKIEDILNNNMVIDISQYDMVGVGHPVLGFGATGIADKFSKYMPNGNNKPAFVFKTASSHHYLNQGASKTIIRNMKKNGYDVFHNSIIAMACNWFLKYEDTFIKQLFEAAEVKTERIAEEINNKEKRILKINPILSGIFSVAYYLEEHVGAKQYAKNIKVSDKCTKCKKCLNSCPSRNISEADGKITFGKNCVWCMRCAYICPVNALQPGAMKSCKLEPFNGGYYIDRVLNNKEIGNIFVTKETKGYYKHFIKYLYGDKEYVERLRGKSEKPL